MQVCSSCVAGAGAASARYPRQAQARQAGQQPLHLQRGRVQRPPRDTKEGSSL